jgi:hypothetical protein
MPTHSRQREAMSRVISERKSTVGRQTANFAISNRATPE